MPTRKMIGYTGVGSVTLATERSHEKELEASLHYRDQDIRNVGNVNYVDSKPRINHSWMYFLLTETYVMSMKLT